MRASEPLRLGAKREGVAPRVRAVRELRAHLDRAGAGERDTRADRRGVRAADPVDRDARRDADAAALAPGLAARLAVALAGGAVRLRQVAAGLAVRVRVVLDLVVRLRVGLLAAVGVL